MRHLRWAGTTITGITLVLTGCTAGSDAVLDAGGDTGRPTGQEAAALLASSHPQAPDLPPPADDPEPGGRPVLYGGERNAAVSRLQRDLNRLGIAVPSDGAYGPATVAGLREFQRGQGIPPDGVVGSATWAALADPKPTTTTTAPPPTAAPPPTPPPTAPPPTLPPPSPMSGAAPQPAWVPLTRAVVYLSTQQVELFDGAGILRWRFPISSGANGATPPGTFHVFRRVPRAISDSDDTVWMPNLVNFNGGIGFHGIPVKGDTPLWTPLGQRPVSHGCIRMANDAAKLVYDHLQTGATVEVVR